MKTNLMVGPKGHRQSILRNLLGWSWLPLCALLACSGCQPRNTGAAEIDPVGQYTLASIDGKDVPCTLTHGGHAMKINSGSFIINPDGTCRSKMLFTVGTGGEVNREVKAAYTRKDATLTMKWEGAGTTIGQMEGNTFTMTNEGMVLTYRK